MAKAFSTKRLAIDKANATLVLAVSIAAFVVVFSLVASKALLSQRAYQSKVISKKQTALKTLKANNEASDQLITSYKEFSGAAVNVLGGNPKGDAERDGDNPRIILDALPSKYDFPALTTSLEKMLKDNGFTIASITGTDDEVSQSGNQSASSPQPIEIPFTVEVNTSGQRGKDLMQLFERSIRPVQVQKLEVAGQGGQVKFTITAKTYFQPEKNLNLRTEPVK
jgi:flagellar motor switch/type III secretory pathway protein FliN